MKEWIVCEDNCLKCSYGATLDCDGDCPRCPRNTYCPCVTFVSFAAGKLNNEIAAELFVSVRTVEHHRSNICSKLGLNGKHALLTFALTHKGEI